MMDQPAMQQDQHESHNMPSSDYAGDVIPMPSQSPAAAIGGMLNRIRDPNKPDDNTNVVKIPNERYR